MTGPLPAPYRHLDWHDQASCASVDPDLFFAASETRAPLAAERLTRAAISVCRACPVQAECLQQALEDDDRYAILGGTTPVERARMLGRKKRAS